MSLPTNDLKGRTAIVTGASSGIGERYTRLLHDEGMNVVVAARRVERLSDLSAELDVESVIPVQCDVSLAEDRQRVVNAALERFGAVDLLVNNAGISVQYPAESEPLDEWTRVLDVNLTGLFGMTQLVARGMLERGAGSIVNIASILGIVASAPIKQASYAASKGAVVNLTRELGCQWARQGVRVNAIAPGWFETEMTASEMFQDEASMTWVRRNCPMGRPGELRELDGPLLFLAGDSSSYVTGVTIPIDGGWTAR